MCRHLAYLGPPVTLRSVLIDPPFGLYRQAWAPRFQRPGAVNADGFGVGWYCDASGDDPGDLGDLGGPEPARYRQAVPIWADQSVAELARVTRTGALLAMVRNATPGTSQGPAAAGEEMRTEVSAKFRRQGVQAELAAAGFAMRTWWTDSAGQFGLSLSVPV